MKKQKMIIRAAAVAALAILTGSRSAHAGQQGDAVTISWSGATFMRSFTTSRGITLLTPGTSITLNAGPGGAPVTFTAPSGSTTSVQLAATDLTVATTPYTVVGPNNAANANYYGMRFEWHEQGSIEGITEMINDQIGQVGSIIPADRNGSFGNPTWINSNSFGANNLNVIPLPPTYGNVTVKGHTLSTSDYNTNFGGNFNDTVAAQIGRNTQGGQNRVQLAVSDVNAIQGFNKPGTAAWNRVPGTAGYGKGNPALPVGAGGIQGLGNSGVRHEFNAETVINMPTSQVDPTTGSNYTAGPWNTAGLGNLDNNIVAIGGMAYVANPGTGLERINRSDNQWLHATGRLQNGADFNVVTRDAYSGTVNSATNNIGLDTSWATGENDDGSTVSSNPNATGETRIGSTIKFSGKTSGGQGVRPTVQNSRMSFGHLSSSDAIPTAKQSNSRPMRVLMYRDDADDISNGSNNTLAADLRNYQSYADPISGSDASLDIVNGFTRLTARSIVEGSYESRTNQTYVTVKRPDAAFSGLTPTQWAALKDTATGIKGDNSGNDVADMRGNIFQSVANFPSASVANPADQLLQLSYMLPQMVKFLKQDSIDGLNRDVSNPGYLSGLASTFLGSSLATPFNADSPETVTTGTTSNYGNNNIGNASATPTGGNIRINNGNWLFGDFDQRTTNIAGGISGKGYRDMSDLTVAQQAQAALQASGLGNDWDAVAASNNTIVAGLPSQLVQGAVWSNSGSGTTPTKGDLIVLGDYNSDGRFDGKDLYSLARGTSLASNTGTIILGVGGTAFADDVRHGVLRKNAALDLVNSTATATQKIQASANLANDPTGANAFRKEDVNRDGLIDLKDAKLVDYYCGKDFRVMDDQLAAVQGADGDSPLYTASTTLKPISLVDVELNDTGGIDTFDFRVIRPVLGAALKDGDTDFNGVIDFDDYVRTDAGYNTDPQDACWSSGDFDSNGAIDFDDYVLLDFSYNSQGFGSMPFGGVSGFKNLTPGEVLGYHVNVFGGEFVDAYNNYLASVPEPATLSVLGLAGALMLRRRGR